MAIQISDTTVIDDSRNIQNVGIITATEFVGSLTGTATTATNAEGLTGTPDITVNNVVGAAATYSGTLDVNSALLANETRLITGSEKTTLVDGNIVDLVYTSGSSSNIGICTNATGDITLNVTGVPTSSDFDNHSITFSLIIQSTGTARTCTAVNLNQVSKTIRWSGGSLDQALSGVTTTNGYIVQSFTGINTIGSASTTANYEILANVSGGFYA